jgi:NAD(P)-dependent dehydrogenase (short-subunit alcohol dehydrogenase family)
MSNNQSLAGSRVVVVGASSGTGRAVARAASAQGAHVFLLSRTREKLEKVREDLSGPAEVITLNMLDESSVAEAFSTIDRSTILL